MEIRKFVSEMFGELNVFTTEDGTLWFYGNEIATLLGYSNPGDAVNKFVGVEDRKTLKYKAFRESRKAEFDVLWKRNNDFSNKVLITEYGMYSLVMRSNAPRAREFQHWVTHEVLPSIRRNGGYVEGQEDLPTEERAALEDQIKVLRDKVDYLRKRRHELVVENRGCKEKAAHLKKENRSLNDCIDVWEGMYDVLMADYEKIAAQVYGGTSEDTDPATAASEAPRKVLHAIVDTKTGSVLGTYFS